MARDQEQKVFEEVVMNGFRRVSLWTLGLVWLAVGVSCADNVETVTTDKPVTDKPGSTVIPLDQIWAFQMPGTRPMQDGQRGGKYLAAEGELLNEIRRALVRERREGTSPIRWKDAKPSFAVLGTGLDALREVHAVLVKKQEPQKSFPADAEITLVFFSNQSGSFVHLQRVEKSDNQIKVFYQFTGHNQKYMTSHFALIPLGALPPGEVSVEIIQMPEPDLGDFYSRPVVIPPELAQQVVCQSFMFLVQSPKEK